MYALFVLAARASAACGDDAWGRGVGLDASTSPFEYRAAPAHVSDALLIGTVGGALAGTGAAAFSERGVVDLRAVVGVGGAVIVTWGATTVVKGLACRPRPYTWSDAYTSGAMPRSGDDRASFFSGHTSATAAASFALATVATLRVDATSRPVVAPLAFVGATALTALVGALRVDAGEHYLSDVVVGGLVGSAVGVGVPLLTEAIPGLVVSTTGSASPATLSVSGTW